MFNCHDYIYQYSDVTFSNIHLAQYTHEYAYTAVTSDDEKLDTYLLLYLLLLIVMSKIVFSIRTQRETRFCIIINLKLRYSTFNIHYSQIISIFGASYKVHFQRQFKTCKYLSQRNWSFTQTCFYLQHDIFRDFTIFPNVTTCHYLPVWKQFIHRISG